jgi:hypothetical protein
MSAQSWLMLTGAAMILLGGLLRWRVSRYDLKDAAIDSAWTLARGKRTAENPTALEAKYREIESQPTWTGRAKKTAGTVAGHFISQALGVVSLVMMLAGLAAMLVGWLWR